MKLAVGDGDGFGLLSDLQFSLMDFVGATSEIANCERIEKFNDFLTQMDSYNQRAEGPTLRDCIDRFDQTTSGRRLPLP